MHAPRSRTPPPPPKSVCVHCVVRRAAAVLVRRGDPVVVLSSARPPLVAEPSSPLYRKVFQLLAGLAEDADGTPLKVRIVDDAHAHVEVMASVRGSGGMRVRSLQVPRHASGTLAAGFAEDAGEGR